ncbi:hypothetical protein POJ06DRAFT_63062 [Lipomyces tetrasporus]|uniref:C2H2-type domain-containing protein n=1 Tax=Lipomyces tetrasporus TaxID=54092 RepID=A0AAD7QX67_9ASCO|nr:uncharacterized protein POJ06DRAFT_63062 [Lipomyces tetrasporus]KAJ8103114.1 hypothetical protein POJ06DRAFT_63062 [Lipomyces tetrasporus]
MARTNNGPPPRRATANPAPRTEAAKQALKNFYCELCQKGYSRMDEYENHTNSYEHQHRKRFNELRQMQKDTASIQQRREREAKESGMRAIALDSVNVTAFSSTSKSAGFKSIGGGFRRVGTDRKQDAGKAATDQAVGSKSRSATTKSVDESDSESDGEYEHYDPRFPTG